MQEAKDRKRDHPQGKRGMKTGRVTLKELARKAKKQKARKKKGKKT